MSSYFEVTATDKLALAILDVLQESGQIKPYNQTLESYFQKKDFQKAETSQLSPAFAAPYGLTEPQKPALTGLALYTSAGYTLEKTVERMAKDILGTCEDQKKWDKNLRNAVKEYGHDEILEGFYNWACAQGTFLGRNPVSQFLKNVSSYVRPTRATVSNPALERTERAIAYASDNLVIFTGEYRFRLAGLINEFGLENVTQAFKDFYATVDEKSRPWAARDFLLKAPVMIAVIQRKQAEADQAKQAVDAAYAAAQGSVETEEEESEL